MRKLTRLLGLGLLLALAAPTAVHADAITYTDRGNVWVASPDGAVKKQVTTNGEPEGIRYFGPSQADDGRIAVIYGPGTGKSSSALMQVLSSTGKLEKTGLLQMVDCGIASTTSAFGTTRIDPAGDSILYDYICISAASGTQGVYTAIASAGSPGVMSPPLQVTDVWQPGWLPSTAAGAAAPDTVVLNESRTALGRYSWTGTFNVDVVFAVDFQQTDERFGRASMSRTGNILAYGWEESDGSKSIYVARLAGPFLPSVQALAECRLPTGANADDPSISPDGTRVAWQDDGGAKVATVSVPSSGSGQPCGGSTTLLSQSGKFPVFSAASAPKNGSGGDSGGGSGGGGSGGGSTGGLSVKGPSKATLAKVAKGLSFSTRCSAKCTVKATMTAGGKAVARASKKLKRKGTASLKLKARLPAGTTSVTVVVTSGSKSATRTVPISG
ncbi:MAG: hypothetical protein ACKOT0_05230 [bacterium]